ncbi:MAG: hypothetical protein IPI48_01175 [bacterium]|nr:hypothetical protein [bacterium]
MGIPDEEKVVKELETKDALTLDLEHAMQLGGIRTLIKASHMTDDQTSPWRIGAQGALGRHR